MATVNFDNAKKRKLMNFIQDYIILKMSLNIIKMSLKIKQFYAITMTFMNQISLNILLIILIIQD